MPVADRPQKTLYSVVLPVYKESGHLINILDEIRRQMDDARAEFELVIVDDGSPDDTWAVISQNAERFPMLRAFRLSRNFGKEHALCAGLEAARGHAVIVMDADGQHPPSLLPEMIATMERSGADIVEATKSYRGKESAMARLSARLFYRLWDSLSGFELTGASDFKLLSRRAVDAYLTMTERNVFFRGMTAWLGFRREKVPFEVADRSGGSSQWSSLKLLRLALTGITSFSALPLQAVTLMGVVFLLFAFVFAIQTIYVYLKGDAVTGFATVILLLLIIGSFLMISLGIIGEYLARIYEEVKFRPRYIIAGSIDPTAKEQTGAKP